MHTTNSRPMYVGRPSVSADSDHSSALIAQMQATTHAASFSSSHPVDSTPDTKHGTSSVLCAAAAYRYLIGDSVCIFQCSHTFILSHGTSIIHHSSSFYRIHGLILRLVIWDGSFQATYIRYGSSRVRILTRKEPSPNHHPSQSAQTNYTLNGILNFDA
jgi:hypothetical protein